MSPKSRNLAGDGCAAAAAAMKMKKKKRKRSKLLGKEKKMKTKLKLSELEKTKSLYICNLESRDGTSVSYVIRSIKLSRLLTSPSGDDDGVPRLQQVGYKAGGGLPGDVGCGVLGSRVVFVGGVTPAEAFGRLKPDAVLHKDVYVFETKTEDEEIKKLGNVSLLGDKINPLVVEVGGQLYSLCYTGEADPPAFEVFDSTKRTCSALPQPPFQLGARRYSLGNTAAYAIAGTKVFVSGKHCPVFCFDVSNPDSDWRRVPTMCEGGGFPFVKKALVLDLPGGGNNKKIVFGHNVMDHPKRLGVYVMSGLDGNEESMRQIGFLKLPEYPYELGEPSSTDLVHIGGNKACLVITQLMSMEEEGEEDQPRCDEQRTHETQRVVIPFEFEVDITKLDKKQCLTLQFMPPRVFQYHADRASFPYPITVGCFVL